MVDLLALALASTLPTGDFETSSVAVAMCARLLPLRCLQVSPAGHPHAAGVSYCAVDERLYVNTHRASRKARNVAADGRVGVVIPVRRLPVGPPFNVQFQGTAALLAQDDPEITALLARGELRGIVSHGELDEPDGCFMRIEPTRRIHTYGIGVSVIAVARDPLHNGPRSITVTGPIMDGR
jgi:hypothetical protein